MKIKFFVLALCSLFLTNFISAQDKKILSLQEAIELSLKNSKQLKGSQAKLDEASAAVDEAKEKKLPSAALNGSYMRILNADFKMENKNNSSGGGGTAEPTKINQAIYGMLNVSLPVYSGGRIQYGIESARFLEQAAKLDAENDKNDIIQNTIEAFANLFKANTAVMLVKENLLQSQARAKDFSRLEQNGLLARNDLLKAELQSSNIELSLLDAQNNRDIANLNMNLMLGLPDNTQLVPDTNNIERKDDARVLGDFIKLAQENRKDIAAIDFRKKAAETSIKSIRTDYYPNVSFTGGYIAADVPKVFSVTNAVNIGVGVTYNISSIWKTKSKIRQAEARVKQIEATEAMLDDDIRMQVNKSYLSLLSYRKKIEVYAKAVEQAKENYRIVKNKFDNGLATTSDLLEADVAQLQATLSYTLARADAFVAYHKLLQTAGVSTAEITK
jgi:outer membrane protein